MQESLYTFGYIPITFYHDALQLMHDVDQYYTAVDFTAYGTVGFGKLNMHTLSILNIYKQLIDA